MGRDGMMHSVESPYLVINGNKTDLLVQCFEHNTLGRVSLFAVSSSVPDCITRLADGDPPRINASLEFKVGGMKYRGRFDLTQMQCDTHPTRYTFTFEGKDAMVISDTEVIVEPKPKAMPDRWGLLV
jgi:hypothetical protein